MYSQWVEQEQGSSYSVAEREHEGSSEREREGAPPSRQVNDVEIERWFAIVIHFLVVEFLFCEYSISRIFVV